jgi:diguanylate cyclase (GGDEF)-like protein
MAAKAYAAERRLTGARLIVIAVNTLIYATVVNKAQTLPTLAYATIALSWIYAIYVYVAEPYRRYPVLSSSYFTSTTDAILIAIWLLSTGGAHSPFYLTLYLSMLAISLRFSARETVFAGTLHLLAYAALLLFTEQVSEHLSFVVVRLAYIPMAGMLGIVISRELYEKTVAKAEAIERHLVNHDALTGLPNRNLLLDRITQALARPLWHKRSVGILYLNLDRLQVVNDSLGHNMGDELLRAAANRLLGCIREGDTVARVGGDEFVVLLADIAQQEDAGMVAQKVLTRLAEPLTLENNELFVTASIGISVVPDDGADAETLLRNAAASMAWAKEQGKNSYRHYSPSMNSRSAKRLALEANLRRALERGEFVLYYQPIVDLNRQEIVSMEALVRWRHPELGLVPPGEFIPLAEETGLIVPIGDWVLQTACAQNVKWQESGISGMCVAVNLSARQFHQQNLVEVVGQALRKTNLAPQWLELELTETMMMRNEEASIATLLALRRMGVRLSIDDFGTGYSSLSYLKRFPISTLKIDQAFVRNISTDPNDRAIVSAIVTLGHSLNLAVLAEAVETAEQLELLRLLHCDQVQGYFFSKPLPAENATQLLANDQKLCALVAGAKAAAPVAGLPAWSSPAKAEGLG